MTSHLYPLYSGWSVHFTAVSMNTWCMYQEKGIGRPMKVGKEGVIGVIAAVERWASLDRPGIRKTLEERLARARDRLGNLPGITASIEVDATSQLFSRLLLHVDPGRAGMTAYDLSARLWDQRPSIAVRSLMADIGLLQVDLRRADDATAEYVIGSIDRILREANGTSAASERSKISPNLADLAEEGLKRFPLALEQRV